MRIGIVCPYSFDAHGGVQVHVMDLAGELFRRGHEVQVLAPASQDTELPDWVTSAGDSIAIPYNGSVARLNFGALVARRARRWLEAGARTCTSWPRRKSSPARSMTWTWTPP